jgi:hypothetical protein
VKGKDDQVNGDSDKNYFEALEGVEAAEQAGRPQPWSRQLGESAKAYAAFSKYRDLAERRTMKKVGEMSGCSTQNIERWARRWNWTHRAYMFDAAEEAKWREQSARDRLAHHRRQVQLGQAVQSIAAHGLAEWQRKIEMKLPLDLRPDELAVLLRLGDDLESKGLGTTREGRFTKINVVLRRQGPDEDAKLPPALEGQVVKPN